MSNRDKGGGALALMIIVVAAILSPFRLWSPR
jgi:hypothetical protein